MKKRFLLALVATIGSVCAFAQAPNTISGLKLWLDGSDPNGNGTAPGNGSAVVTWTDKSGNGLNAVALGGGGTTAPVYNSGAIGTAGTISFNRTASVVAGYTVPGLDIRAAVRPDVTIFTVYRQGATANLGQQAVWGNDNGGWDRFLFTRLNGNDGAVSRGQTVAPFTIDLPNAGAPGLVRLVTTLYDGNVSGGVNNGVDNGSAVYFNGQLVATTSDFTHASNAQTALRIGYDGDDNFFQGEIAEMIVYERKLTGCEIQTVNRYLSDKYSQAYKFPTATADGATTVCSGGFVSMNSSMVDGNEWQSSANGTTWVTIPGATSQQYTATASGFYRVRICGNEASSPITVTVNAQPTATFSYPGTPFCPSGTAMPTLTGTAGGTWTSTAGLSLNAGTGAIDLAASTPGLYTVTYTVAAAGGCSQAQSSVRIGINTQADVTQPANATACAGSTTTLTAFAGTAGSYTWTNNNTATGLAASGSGNIAAFTASNGGNTPLTSTITVTPVGSGLQGFAYIPNLNGNTVSVLNLANNVVVATIPVANGPFGVTVLPDRSKVLVASSASNVVSVINTASNTVVGTSPYNNPHGLVPSPDGSRVYVNGYTPGNSGALSWIDMSSPTYVSNFMAIVPNPEGMAVSPDGQKVYVASATAPGYLYVVNTTAPYTVVTVAVGDYPQGVAVAPNGRFIYVTNANNASVSVIDASTYSVQNIPVGTAPLGIAISPDGSRVYVSNAASNAVSVINTATNTVLGNIPVGTYPYGISVSPDGGKVYVANRLSNNLSIIDASLNTGSTVAFAGANGPIGIGNMLAATYQCNGTPKTFTLTVNPKPSWNNAGFSTSICNNQGIGLSISNGGNVPGADYSWTLDNPAIGADATGSGNGLSFTGTNPGTTNISGLFTVTPSYTNNGVTCAGNANTFTITVKPSTSVNVPGSQSVCAGGATAAVTFSGGIAGTTYSWVNANPSIGLAASGSGDIPSFTAVNAGSTPQTATIFVTPTANGCQGQSRSFTITVNPQPAATISYSGSPFCATGTATPTRTGTGGGTYTSASGLSINTTTGVIDLAASTAGTYTITYTVPAANGCSAVTATASVTINASVTVNAPGNQALCAGAASTAVTFSGTAGSYTWTNSNPSIGLAASGSGNIASFTAVNGTNAPATATVTVTPVGSSSPVSAAPLPDLFYYTFEGTGTSVPNLASAPPAGTTTATIGGGQTKGAGTCGNSLIGTGQASTGDYVNTNWAPNLGNSSWTLSFKTSNVPSTTSTYYILGDVNAGGFRVFTGGVAGAGNWILRGPLADVLAPGGASTGASTTTFVYDAAANVIHAYVNGTLVQSVPQGGVSFTGAGPFKVGGYSSSASLPAGSTLDNFRLYSRALSAAEVQLLDACETYVSCNGTPQSFTITVNPAPTASISYSGTPFCATGTATLTFSGTTGGSYSSTTGLSIDATTGVIDLAASTPGTYTVTYTIAAANGCSELTSSTSVTIQAAAVITQPGNQTVCGGSATSAVTFSGTNGSGFTWTNNTPGIGLAASGTGNLPAFTAVNNSGAPVTATITVSMTANAGFCAAAPKTFTITVSPQRTASFSYTSSPYCSGTGTASPTFAGTAGGTYSSTTGLSLNSSTGAVDIAASTPGTYTVTYTIAASGPCPQVTATANITINPPVTATISASGPLTICSGGSVTLSAPTTPGATYLWSNGATTSSISASAAGNYSVTVTANGCVANGGPVTVSVNPVPTVNAITAQTLCAGGATTAVSFSGTVPGTVYTWANSNSAIGLAATGTGNIASFTAVNSTATAQTATITVTPSYTAGGVTCTGSAATFTITVNPTPTVAAVASQTVCAGAATTAVTFSGAVSGSTYTWTNSNPSIGLGATGSGNIASFTAANATATAQTATITVLPSAAGCPGAPQPFTITVNPAPTVNAIVSQNLCNGANTTAVTFSGSVPGTVYNWANNTTSIGLAASGSGNIASFAAVNNGTAAVTALVTVTPSYTAGGTTCPGTAASFSITVNPTPTVNTVASQIMCNNTGSTAVVFSGTVASTAYTWTNNNPSIGLAPSGSGNIASFTAVNNGTAPVTATITVTPQATLSGRAYVPNNTSGTVSMIDLSTGAAIGSPITVGANPFGVAVLPDRSKIYVSNTGGNSVSVINTTTNSVTGSSPYNAPHGLAASPDGTRVYVNGWTDNAVSWIDVASNVSTFMTNVTQPEGMAVSADGARLYVASSVSAGKLVVLNTASNAVLASIGVGAFPQGVALSADGSKVYVVNNGSASVSVISTASNSVTATIPVGADPLGVAVSPDGSKVYVTNSGNNNVSVINTATNALTASIAVGNYPYGVAVSPDGSTVYVANRNSNSVSIINAATNAVTSVAVGAAPIALGQFTTASLQCAGTPKTFTITVNPTPVVNAVTGQTLCAGAATTAVSFSGAVPGTVFNWTNNNPSIGLAASGTGNIAAFTAVNATATVQTATITVTPSFASGGQTCTGTPVTFTITVNPTPAATAVSSQVLCNGSATAAVSFSGPVSGTTYSWTNSNTSIGLAGSGTGNIASFTAVNSSSTVQVATITVIPSAAGCPGAAQTFTITVNPTPSVNVVTNQSLCNGANTTAISFGGSVAGAVYNWTNNTASIGLAAAGTGNIASFAALNNTNAAVTATITVTPSFSNSGQTCAGNPATFTITVNPTPSVTALAGQAVCNRAATTAVNFSGAVSGTTYSWTNSTPSIGLAAAGTGDIASFTATNSTTLPVTATITVTPSAAGCAGSVQTFTITVNPTAVVNAVAPVTVCAGQGINVPNFNGPVAGTQFSWANDNTAIGLGAAGSGNIAPFTAVNNGTTPIVANVTVTPTANGCAGTAVTFAITVNPLPTGTITAPNGTLICAGGSTQLQASGGTSYQWFLGGNPIPGATGATFNASTAGTYTVNISNSFGCTRAASNSIVLTLVQKPTAGFTFNSYCVNTPVQFTNTSGTGGSGIVTYQWSFGNGQNSTLQHPAATYGGTGNYTVQLIASPNGCTSLNDTVRQTIRIEAPLPGQRLATQDVVSGRATELHARNLPNGRYSWTPATGLSNPFIWYPVATLSQQQEYRIQVSFASGCVTVDTLLVRVQKGDDIFVPTAFSPDGDGVNDLLKPITVGLTTFRYFRVYDQLGREVFATTAINQGWDGRYKGQPLRADTYIWVAEGRDSSG
ncbi:PKD-like domain-containing protein, partial [Flaviaesturariibacter aridisoli]